MNKLFSKHRFHPQALSPTSRGLSAGSIGFPRKLLLVLIIFTMLIGCSSNGHNKNQAKTYEVQPESVHKTLFFTGTIKPLQEATLITPLDAVVAKINHHFGQKVKKGEVIFTLNSNQLQKQYNETLTEFLKAKDSYTIAEAKFRGTKDLWDSGLISKNNFMSEESSLATVRVSLMQATQKLKEMVGNMDEDLVQNLSSLSIAEFDKVRKALAGNHHLIHIKAPAEGVLLYPPKTSEDNSNQLKVGSALKSGQVVALVGDMKGISVEIDIPEVDISKIHSGMKASVRGVALGNEVLKGELVAVNAQANNATGSNLPSFSALIEVRGLSEQQQALIKVGMSASIELAIDSNEQLLIPIAALGQEKGLTVVKLQGKDGALKTRRVTTGAALADKVVVASGLRVGDVVAYD